MGRGLGVPVRDVHSCCCFLKPAPPQAGGQVGDGWVDTGVGGRKEYNGTPCCTTKSPLPFLEQADP